MNMTSGIPTYNIWNINRKKQYSMEELVNIAKKENNPCVAKLGCFYPAGTKWFYSNTNYIILGLIVEKYTHESFTKAITQYIFDPLKKESKSALYVYYVPHSMPKKILSNMIHGSFNNQFIEKTSKGFLQHHTTLPYFPKTWIDVTNLNLSWAATAGALIGNMDTLVQLTSALYHNQLIAPSSDLEKNAVLMRNGKLVKNIEEQCAKQSCYAMGIFVLNVPSEGGLIWHYQGSDIGYNTLYFWIPTEDVTIAIAQSTGETVDSGDASLINLAFKINTQIRKYLKLSVSKTEFKTNAY